MHIKYSSISGFQNLFIDYVENFDRVKEFFDKDYRDLEKLPKAELNVKTEEQREKLFKILEDQYKELSPCKQTQLNIESLKNQNTFAIVTGQQLGIFGGPLYTFYKIMSAIKLSNFLKVKFEDYNFVPVFWLEGDDHDFDEVRKFNIVDDNNEVKEIIYDDGLEEDVNRGNVGSIKFNENLQKVFEQLDEILRDTEFKPDLLELLKKNYSERKTFEKSFRDLLFELFDEYGVIFFDPGTTEVKELLVPIFEQELDNFRKNTHQVIERSALLEEKYHAQVKVKPVNIFLTEDDGRYSLEPVESEFRLKGKRKKFSKEELIEKLKNSPDKFSPNVLLRPICQDYLLPTAIYIGGPSEISYFAQVMPLYNNFNINAPYIYPRSSATIVEKTVKNVIEKYDLDFEDVFSNPEDLKSKVISRISEMDLEKTFSGLDNQISNLLESAKEDLAALDKNLTDVLDKTKDKISNSLSGLKDKSEKAQQKKHNVAVRQIEKVLALILPKGNLQEREINFVYFADKYGIDFVKWLFNELKINKFEHQILEL